MQYPNLLTYQSAYSIGYCPGWACLPVLPRVPRLVAVVVVAAAVVVVVVAAVVVAAVIVVILVVLVKVDRQLATLPPLFSF